MNELGAIEGHAFISYVGEDAAEAGRLQQVLEAAGVRVWRDKSDLWPGEDWREKIRRAITADALVFIACFSRKSVARKRSYQNEEIALAIEQLRLRRPGESWLMPVRFDDCKIPDLDIGSGRTLASIQRADLFGDHSDEGTLRLVRAILRILGQYSEGNISGNFVSPSREEAELSNEATMLAAEPNRVRAAILESMRRESAEIRDQSTSTTPGKGFVLQPTPRTLHAEQRHFRVGMLGPVASGKTTYLAILDFALARATDNWTIRGADLAAEQFLSERVMMLAQRRFPEATYGSYHLSFVLTGTAPVSPRRGRLFYRRQPMEVQLDLVDMPGEYALLGDVAPDSTSLGPNDYRDPREEALNSLANCDGIILLFDPVLESERSHYYEYLRRALLALSNRSRDRGSRLPHYVAVCITKFDDPYVYRKAAAGGYVKLTESTNSMPQINEEQARMFFRDLCVSTKNADLVMPLLEHYFHTKYTKYFVTSSIGFYIDPATGRFDSSNFNNVVEEGKYGERRIRGRVRPVNVIEPLLWLIQQRPSR